MKPRHRAEPKWITEEILAIVHAQQIERYGGAHGILDENAVLGALNRAINRWSYDEKATLPDLAAVYLTSFAGSQGFTDGNKRTGLACALVFLGLNDLSLEVDRDDLYELTLRVATHQIKDAKLAEWFRKTVEAARG